MDGPRMWGLLAGIIVTGGLWAIYQRRSRRLPWRGALLQAALVAGIWATIMMLVEYALPMSR